MAKVTMFFGVLLALVGGGWFVATGSAHKTALIPLWFGLVLILCGVIANTKDAKKRGLWMHIAVTVGLLGFLFPAVRGGMALLHSASLTVVQRTAMQEELTMAFICLVFTAVCVRSFIAARRGRLA